MMTLLRRVVDICALLLCSFLFASGQVDYLPELYSGYFPELQEDVIKEISLALPAKCVEIKHVSGLNNNNFLITCENGQKFIIKIPEDMGFRISYESQMINQNLACQIGLAPRMQLLKENLVLIDFVQPIKPYVVQKDTLAELASVLARLHYSSLVFENRYDFCVALKHYSVFCEKKQCLSDLEKELVAIIAEKYELFSKALHNRPIPLNVACHNDLHPGNILVSAAGIQLIDWEDSALNDPAWDIAQFLLISFVPQDLWSEFFSHYLPLIPYDDPSFVNRVKLYRPFILMETFLSLKTRLDNPRINSKEAGSLLSMCIEGIQAILNSEKYQRDFNAFLLKPTP